LQDASWASHSLHYALKEQGFHVSKDLIVTHRKGVCKCYRISKQLKS
jgi:hypothetical protein